MADFFSLFRPSNNAPVSNSGGQGNQQPNTQQQVQQTQQQNEPGNRPTNAATIPPNTNGAQPNPNDPNAQSQQKTNPLDSYSKIFDTTNTSGDAPPTFSIDPKQMDSIVGSLDFTKGIDPAVMQKATQGDANSLMEVIHHVGRNSYRAAIEHGGVLTDKFIGAREGFASKQFPTKVREELVSNQLALNTPNFQHPVVRQQLTEIAKRFQKLHPDATAKEIGDLSIKYLNDLVSAIKQPEEKNQQSNQQQTVERGEEFWNDYFSEDHTAS